MTFEVVDSVPGLGADEVTALVDEAEAGYDVARLPSEPNPHFGRIQLVPADLIDAIDQRALQAGQTPDWVLREALTAYLRSA
ncbi:MAG TPA: hypothetical protein PLX71_07015 [Phycicoccus sp.]|nr:hypothetical protein [Phycicoccus sp.]